MYSTKEVFIRTMWLQVAVLIGIAIGMLELPVSIGLALGSLVGLTFIPRIFK